jgi:hypothetical protein
MAYFGPKQRSRSFEILEIGPLFLRFQKRSGLALNQNLPFLDEHYSAIQGHIDMIQTQAKGHND